MRVTFPVTPTVVTPFRVLGPELVMPAGRVNKLLKVVGFGTVPPVNTAVQVLVTLDPTTVQVQLALFCRLALGTDIVLTLRLPPPMFVGRVAATAFNWAEMFIAGPVMPGSGAVQLKQNFWLFRVE